jgi:hypothetical protein
MTGPKTAFMYGNGRASAAAVILLAARIKFAIQSDLLVEDGPGWTVAGLGVVVVDMRALSNDERLSDLHQPHRIQRQSQK